MEAKLKKSMKDAADKNGKKIVKIEELLAKMQKSGINDMPGKLQDLKNRIEVIASMRVPTSENAN